MRIWKVTAVALGVVVAAAGLALTFGMPAGFLAGTIEDRVEAATGLRLRIAGEARIDFRPSPTITLGNVALRSKDGRDRIVADSVRIAASLQDLVESPPRLREIEILRPVVRVPVMRERSKPTAPAAAAAARPAADRGAAAGFTVDRLVARDGTLELVSGESRVEGRFERVALEGALRADDTFELRASGHSGADALRLEVKGTAPARRFDGSPLPLEFTFEAPAWFDGALAGQAEVKALGSLLSVNALTGRFGRNAFNGWASVDFSDKPLIKLDLDVPRVELEAARPEPAAAATADPDRPWSDHPINLDGLNFFDAEAQVSAAELKVETFRFAPVALRARLERGVLGMSLSQVGLYGGQARGRIAVDASGAQPRYAMRVDLDAVRALPLLTDVAGVTALDGVLQAKIDVRASGASERAVVSTLDGAVDLMVSDGELRTINVARMIRSLMASAFDGWQQSKTEKTDLTQLSALFRIDEGRASTNNLRLAGPLVRVGGAGAVDLAGKTLAFKLDPRLVMSLEGQGGAAEPLGFGVPVVMQGPWSGPRFSLDVAGIFGKDRPPSPQAAPRDTVDQIRDILRDLFSR